MQAALNMGGYKVQNVATAVAGTDAINLTQDLANATSAANTAVAALNLGQGGVGAQSSLASGATTDLGTIASHNVFVTGTTTITSFGSTAALAFPLYEVTFQGILTLTNGASLVIPGGANITTAANDSLTALYLGSGAWQVLEYNAASGQIVTAPNYATSAIGLVVTNGGTPNSQIAVTADAATLTSAAGIEISAKTISVSISLLSTGANGLDAGSVAPSTWYNVFLISNGTTLAGLASTATTPSLPTGYTFSMRVGAMRTDGSSNLLRTIQRGSEAQYQVTAATNTATLPAIATGAHATWFAASVSALVPPTAAKITALVQTFSNFTSYGALAPNGAYAVSASWAGGGEMPPLWFLTGAGGSGDSNGSTSGSLILESSNVYYLGNSASSEGAYCRGWTDKVNAS
jgi:hypothetical protein